MRTGPLRVRPWPLREYTGIPYHLPKGIPFETRPLRERPSSLSEDRASQSQSEAGPVMFIVMGQILDSAEGSGQAKTFCP